MLRKELTMAMLDPLFAIHKWDLDEELPEDMLFIEIDDCDCDDCDKDRGGVMPFSTLRVGIRRQNTSYVARLTPSEAREIAQEMLKYCEMVSELAEGGELDELERFA